MITSCPGCQFTGVATVCLAVSWQEFKQPQDFVEVATGGHRIGQHRFDLLVGADDEHGAHGGIVRGGTAVGGGAGSLGQHVIGHGDLEFGIADHRVVDGVTLRLLDVLGPLGVIFDWVDAQADDLCVALVELRLQPRHVAELGRADRREVLGMREQYRPAIANPAMEVDRALGCLGREIRRFGIDSQ